MLTSLSFINIFMIIYVESSSLPATIEHESLSERLTDEGETEGKDSFYYMDGICTEKSQGS